jgi:hypothetical protein
LDNQQATLDLGWLAGAIDGEGCVGITRRNRVARLGFTLKPHLQIANTDKAFIDRCAGILTTLKIPFHISSYDGKGRRKQAWQITVAGLKRVAKALPLLVPHLTGVKAEKAKLVLEWVDSRLADWHAAPFTSRQLKIYEQLRQMNERGIKGRSLTDYTRSARSSKFPMGRAMI